MTEIEEDKLDRIEVINHFTKDNGRAIGRILTLYKEMGDFNNIEISIQDNGKTLKIFLQ
jgi:hypothetical protein